MMASLLVIGIGNLYRHDDAAGLLAARKLKEIAPGGVTVLEESGEATALIQAWAGADEVVLVDAVSSGAAPGSLYRFEVGQDPLRADLFAASSHTLGVSQAIELARALHCLPRCLTVYGIEGADFSPGVGLSPAVEHSLPVVVQQIHQEFCCAPV